MFRSFVLVVASLAAVLPAGPQSSVLAQNVREKVITRVFWQDAESQKLSYANLTATNRWNLRRNWVSGFPALDPKTQSLGELYASQGQVFVSVESQQDGVAGGWFCLDSGAFEEPHGNHTHWKYTRTPKVRQSDFASGRGQQSSLMLCGDMAVYSDSTADCTIMKAADMKFGGTRGIRKLSLSKPAGLCLDGNGKTIALSGNDQSGQLTAYDRAGNVAGEVALASGNVESALVNSGKVFLAHEGGISMASLTDLSVQKVNGPQPASALNAHLSWVLYTANSGDASQLCLLNGSQQDPEVVSLPIPGAAGTRLSTPEVVMSLGKRYAILFTEREASEEAMEQTLIVVLLDPNKDKNFSDAKIARTISLGTSSAASGEQHGICFDAYGRHAVISSPDDGMLTVLSLQKLNVVARFKVGGKPGRIVAVGAAEHFH